MAFNISDKAKRATYDRVKASRAGRTANLQRRLTANITDRPDSDWLWTELLAKSIEADGDLR